MTLPSPAAETIRIEAANRWDALELAERLRGMHTYLVQLGDARWHVCVRPGDPADDLVPSVRVAAEEWARERHVEAVLRVGGRVYPVG